MNGTGIGSGLGTGIVLGWVWGGYFVPRGNPPMTPDVAGTIVLGAAALGHGLQNLALWWLARRGITPPTPETKP